MEQIIAETQNTQDMKPAVVGQTKKKKLNLEQRRDVTGYIFMAPFLILFITFTLAPIFVAMGISLTNYNLVQTPEFVGLTNYINLILDDDIFLTAIKNTMFFALICGPGGYIASFLFAWLITLLNRAKGVFALAFYAPSLTSSVAMSLIWMVIFAGDRNGYLNNFLLNIGVISDPILFTKDAAYLPWVIVIISLWMSMGNGFLVFLAGLNNIDPELYDAAKVDGIQNEFQKLRYITLPLMKPQLLFGAVNAVVSAFATFDVATSVAGMPSPNYCVHTLVAHAYDYGFIRMEMGYSCSISMVLFVITFLAGRLCFYVFRSDD